MCIVGCNQAHSLIIRAIRRSTKLRRFRVSQVFSQHSGRQTSIPGNLPFEVRSQIQQAASQIDRAIKQGVDQFRRELLQEIEFLEDEVVTIGVGMPLMDTRRFLKISGEVATSIDYEGMTRISDRSLENDKEGAKEGAIFMLNYLSRLVRLIDESDQEVIKGIQVAVPLTAQKWWHKVGEEQKSTKSP